MLVHLSVKARLLLVKRRYGLRKLSVKVRLLVKRRHGLGILCVEVRWLVKIRHGLGKLSVGVRLLRKLSVGINLSARHLLVVKRIRLQRRHVCHLATG